jgi:hypothetical protein
LGIATGPKHIAGLPAIDCTHDCRAKVLPDGAAEKAG